MPLPPLLHRPCPHAAARADNFYYPPSFDPNKHKSLNKVCMCLRPCGDSSRMKRACMLFVPMHPLPFPMRQFQGSHGALGKRAANLDKGVLVIRFEVPFHIICTKCNEMIAKGERFNADKKSIGAYHSTKIWEFRMRHHCGSCIVIVTDPKNSKYLVVEGAREKVRAQRGRKCAVTAAYAQMPM